MPSTAPTNASNLRAPSPASSPTNAIHSGSHHGAVGYMIERLKGRPSFQTDSSRAKDLEQAYKSVAYANELGRLTRTSVEANQAEVHTLLETLEDRIIARFRGIYAKTNIVITKRNPLFEWKYFYFTTMENTLTKMSKKQTGSTAVPFDADIRKTFFTPLVEASIKALEQCDLAKYPRRAQHRCN